MTELSHAYQARLDAWREKKHKVPSASKVVTTGTKHYIPRRGNGDDPRDFETAKNAAWEAQNKSMRYTNG